MEKDLTAEKQHLAGVQQIIQRESDRLLQDLGVMRKDIIENRKYWSEEVARNRFHEMMVGSDVKEDQYTEAYQRVLELSDMYYNPYFGMIEFLEDGLSDSDTEKYYIGKRGLTQNGDPVILDWRTPVSSLFYQQRLGEMSFTAPGGVIYVDLRKRRQYVIKNGELKGMFDSAMDIQDEILQMVLSGSSGERLREVVATIQREQNDLIRAPLGDNVMLDGVAGSGKTTIVLHRVAYLLYNYRAQLKDNILILGPNRFFMEYISGVLPDLGETGNTYQRTLRTLMAEVLPLKRPVMRPQEYYEKLLDGRDAAWRDEVYRRAEASYAKFLDSRIAEYEESERRTSDISFRGQVILKAEEGNELFFDSYRSMPVDKRNLRIKRVIINHLRIFRDESVRRIQKEYNARIAEAKREHDEDLANSLRYEGDMKIQELMEDLYDFRKALREEYALPDTENLYAEWIGQGEEPWTEEDIWAMLYVAARFHGKGLFDVRHVVVDEAQDISALGLAALIRLTGTESMTIVGDKRQKIKGVRFPSILDGWKEAAIPSVRKKTQEHHLSTSYRSTREIMEYAMRDLTEDLKCPVQTIERPGTPVRELSSGLTEGIADLIRGELDIMRKTGAERLAVLTENQAQAQFIAGLMPHETELMNEDTRKIDPAKVPVMPVYFAKGLEYDGVVAIDTMQDKLTHYVLCTRALHQLSHIRLQG
ncbi:MAG: AAA family ATPase [Firmicutes bacterium]|nr:AAA family ATPase [Bacillota bacterium]